MPDNEVLDLTETDNPKDVVKDTVWKESPLTDMDIFKLGKTILRASLWLYVAIVILYIVSSYYIEIKGPAKEIWDFSSQGLFGIINLIIGFYFGGKIAAKSMH